MVTADDIGQQGGNGDINLDEAIVTLKSLQLPLYFIGGKTVMPFGVFEDHLIEGTLAEDLYEVDEWGATLGVNPDFYGLDISVSVYKSAQVIENLQNFDTHEWRSGRQKEDKFRSYITNITLEPLEDTLTLSAFYDNEPGDGSRNQSIGGAFTLNYWKFSLDAEYVAEFVEFGITKTVRDVVYTGVLKTKDYSPIEPGVGEFKYYAPGVGLILEEAYEDDEELNGETLELLP